MDKVRILVTGSRIWEMEEYLRQVFAEIDSELGVHVKKVLVSGHCPQGADFMAEEACSALGWELELHPADWSRHGKAAGFIRNKLMVESEPSLLVAFVQDGSKGAGHTIRLAKSNGLPIRLYEREGKSDVKASVWPEPVEEVTSLTLW